MVRCSNSISAVIAALASTVIVGCASLDDRLASTDPRVKNEAEHELIQMSRATGTESDRIAAINRISNRDFLYEIAMKATTNQWVAEDASFDPSGYDGFQKSGSQGTYYSNMRTYYKTTAYGPIYKSVHGKLLDTTKDGVAAFERLALDITKTDDYKKLFELIRKAESPYVRLAVLKSVKDPKWSQTMAKELARATSDPAIQAEAFARIEPPEARFAAMAQYAVDAKTRKDAFAKLTDQKTIDEVILKTTDKTFLLDGMAKVSDKAALASRVFSKDFIGDKDVTGKFISDYADEAMLVKIVNEHGEELSADQCAAMKAKSNNAELQNAIATLSDKKILPDILAAEKKFKTYRNDPDKQEESKKAIETIISLFSQIHSPDTRTKYFINAMSSQNELSAALVRIAKPEEIVSIFRNAPEKAQKEIIERTSDENVLGLLAAVLKDGVAWETIEHPFYWRTNKFKDVNPKELNAVLVLLPSTLKQVHLKGFVAMAADNSLDDAAISRFKFAGVNNLTVREVLQTVARKLNADAKKKLCDAARKKAEAQKGKSVVFGPFYLGMPYLDALLLQEEIWGVDKGIEIWSNYQEKGEHNISDMASVWKISFNNKAKFQFIDCKDSLVLPQFIHQFVEGKPGKVSSDFGYSSDIKSEYDEKDERIYSAYSNTKRGIKVQYSAKYGILNMVEL